MHPKIDVYSIMRNEVQILPYFLRHYETIADRIFVWDDGSNDGTREMLESHPKVKILPLKLGGSDDSYFVKYLWPQYIDISRGHADWVICVDADEFVHYPGPEPLFEKLDILKSENKRKIRLCGFTMYSPKFPTTTGQIYDEIKLGWVDRWSRKTVLFTPDIKMTWTPGRHQCIPNRDIETTRNTGINLLHFRYLSPEYFLERNKRNCESLKIAFNPKQRYNLPDGTRGIPYEWYEAQKDKLVQIVP